MSRGFAWLGWAEMSALHISRAAIPPRCSSSATLPSIDTVDSLAISCPTGATRDHPDQLTHFGGGNYAELFQLLVYRGASLPT